VREHGLHSLICVVLTPGYQRIREIGKGVQPGIVYFVDYLHDEERVLANRVIVLHIHDDVFFGTVLDHLRQTVRGTLGIRFGIRRLRHVATDAGRSDSGGDIDPLLAESNGLIALGFVCCIGAMLAIHRDIYDHAAGFFHAGANLV